MARLPHPSLARLAGLLAVFAPAVASAQTLSVDHDWVVAHGHVISGTYRGTGGTPAITVATLDPVTITRATLSGPGDLISAGRGANLTVTYTTGTGPGGSSTGNFLYADHPANVRVANCDISGVGTGIGINGYGGDGTPANTFVFDWNRLRNVNGQSYTSARANAPHGIQIGGAPGVPGIEIAHNEIVHEPYVSFVNDVINLYSSGGTAGSHADVHDNFIQGLFSLNPTDENSGVGIICDGWQHDTAATATAFVDIHDNTCLRMSNAGFAIDSGHDNHAFRNTVVSAGVLADGKTVYADTYGNAAAEYDPSDGSGYAQPPTVYFGNTVHDNLLGFMRSNGDGGISRADAYLPGDAAANPYANNSYLDHDPTAADEGAQARRWAQTLADNGWWVGDNLLIDPGFEGQAGSFPNGTLGGHWRADVDSGAAAGTDIDQPSNVASGQINAWVHRPPGAAKAYVAQDGIRVQPNTTYTVTVEVWDISGGAVGGNGGALGVWSDDGSRALGHASFTPATTGYAPASLTFTTGSNDVRVDLEVGISGPGGDAWMRIDEVKLSPQ